MPYLIVSLVIMLELSSPGMPSSANGYVIDDLEMADSSFDSAKLAGPVRSYREFEIHTPQDSRTVLPGTRSLVEVLDEFLDRFRGWKLKPMLSTGGFGIRFESSFSI